MRVPRKALIDPRGGQAFHVVSRVVDRRFIFGDREKGIFLDMVRQVERYSGVQVLAYVILSNHFHLLVHIPPRPKEIDVQEVRSRMQSIYTTEKLEAIDQMLMERREMGDVGFEREYYDRHRARMYDLSAFVKDVKLRFSKWYNYENDRKGTLWEERFRSVLIEGHSNSMLKTAGYIELNPVRAGLVKDPSDYAWGSLGEAISGGERARAGIIRLASGMGGDLPWNKAVDQYRDSFTSQSQHHGKGRTGPGGGRVKTKIAIPENGEFGEGFLRRIRQFTDGLVLGRQEFIREFFDKNRQLLNSQRKKISYPMGGEIWGGLNSYRNCSPKLDNRV
ncbi:MAG: transposase [Verrucomicrobia bacterium]|nr:transposase [Verrucomicrobiota bacterium]